MFKIKNPLYAVHGKDQKNPQLFRDKSVKPELRECSYLWFKNLNIDMEHREIRLIYAMGYYRAVGNFHVPNRISIPIIITGDDFTFLTASGVGPSRWTNEISLRQMEELILKTDHLRVQFERQGIEVEAVLDQ